MLVILAIMILTGVFIKTAGLVGVLLYLYVFSFYGVYTLSYASYFGVFIALFFSGNSYANKYETPIIRVLFGFSLIFAAISIKFLHQSLSIEVYNTYNLGAIFPYPATFVAVCAGLIELVVGIFLFFGFFQRFAVFVFVIFMTLSLLIFNEAIWPHFILLGISIALFIDSGGLWSLDGFIGRRLHAYRR